MSRLINPDTGTVVNCGDDLTASYLARGWADADASATAPKAAPEQPVVPKRGRQTKTK